MTSFNELESFLGKKGERHAILNGKRLTATVIERRTPDRIAVRYHKTDVVTHYRNGDIVLNSGGWQTVTTKRRMNQFSPISVHQSDWDWFANDRPFRDGMRFRCWSKFMEVAA